MNKCPKDQVVNPFQMAELADEFMGTNKHILTGMILQVPGHSSCELVIPDRWRSRLQPFFHRGHAFSTRKGSPAELPGSFGYVCVFFAKPWMKNKHMENIRYRQIETIFPAGMGVNRKKVLKSAPSFDIFVDNCVYFRKKHFQFLEEKSNSWFVTWPQTRCLSTCAGRSPCCACLCVYPLHVLSPLFSPCLQIPH